jgi:hypothetical protein
MKSATSCLALRSWNSWKLRRVATIYRNNLVATLVATPFI